MRSPARAPLLLSVLACGALSAVVAPPWADPAVNPCASRPGGWQLLHWPQDGACYRIFAVGAPCPDTMELGPSSTGKAECRCPPKTAQSPRDANCHKLFEQGPCLEGQYFAPVPNASSSKGAPQWGTCLDAEPCPEGEVFWPREGRCHRRHSRGPCPRGELLAAAATVPPLGVCGCEREGPLAPYYSTAAQSCHEHYTRGPCEQRGHLFLPERRCGCSPDLPHFHPESGKCYEIGSSSPCLLGQQFLLPEGEREGGNGTVHARCRCRPGLVPWGPGGACYRPYTRGPCPRGHILMGESGGCEPVPCRQGRLYFPPGGPGPACHRVGTRGPCPRGQVVLFEPLRISLDGVSHRGVCGCPDRGPCAPPDCESGPGLVRVGGRCHALYARGPCGDGEWLVPDARGARCDCRPGFRRLGDACQSPTVALAKFLNLNRGSEPAAA